MKGIILEKVIRDVLDKAWPTDQVVTRVQAEPAIRDACMTIMDEYTQWLIHEGHLDLEDTQGSLTLIDQFILRR